MDLRLHFQSKELDGIQTHDSPIPKSLLEHSFCQLITVFSKLQVNIRFSEGKNTVSLCNFKLYAITKYTFSNCIVNVVVADNKGKTMFTTTTPPPPQPLTTPTTVKTTTTVYSAEFFNFPASKLNVFLISFFLLSHV